MDGSDHHVWTGGDLGAEAGVADHVWPFAKTGRLSIRAILGLAAAIFVVVIAIAVWIGFR